MMEETLEEVEGDDATRMFECSACKMTFPEEWKLTAHHFSEHEQARWDIDGRRLEPQYPVWKGYECNFCHRLFDKLQDLQRHYERRRQMIEKRNLTRLPKLLGSIDKKKGLRLGASICKICDERFKSRRLLRNHLKIHSKREQKRIVKCDICKRIFANSSNLRRHNKRFHLESGFQCDMCDDRFPTRLELKGHRKEVHAAAKLYPCIFCDKNLSDSDALTMHIRRHIGERSFVCFECGASFVRRYDRRRHQRDLHPQGTKGVLSRDLPQNNKVTSDKDKLGLSLPPCQVNLVRCDPQVPKGQRHLLLQQF